MRNLNSPPFYLKRSRTAHGLALLFVAAVLSLASSHFVSAQTTPQANADSPALAAQAEKARAVSDLVREDSYRIGPGDVLDIRVFNKPQFSRDAVRVDGRGMIRMPFIEGEIRAACQTEAELAKSIVTLLLEYIRRPQVDVFVKEFQSQAVAVIGAVRNPSRFQLQRRLRLLDLISYVNGPSENAGRSVQVIHTANKMSCEAPTQGITDEVADVDYYKLSDTLKGDASANPFVRGGDIISITEADQVYVIGNVTRPSALPLKEPITISRAIAMVGGTLEDTKKERVRIIRQVPGSSSKTEIFVNLKAIDKRQAEDIELLANDVVDVPTNSGKRLLKSFLGAIVPNVASLPVRVIP
ncbi:MAG TPA: polysaccharide biosynthesis/export family protein [Pyrinomonadaceae bacterium]|nr:polysaccharide biosynthesis/export family protein [Pyrinomonadaceae bacterium]